MESNINNEKISLWLILAAWVLVFLFSNNRFAAFGYIISFLLFVASVIYAFIDRSERPNMILSALTILLWLLYMIPLYGVYLLYQGRGA